MKKFKYISILIALTSSLVIPSYAEKNALWNNLEEGTYGVGFKKIITRDYTRSYGFRGDQSTPDDESDISRPITIFVWYPADKEPGGVQMSFERYIHAIESDSYEPDDEQRAKLTERFITPQLQRGIDKDLLLRLLSTPSGAFENANPVKGSFPLVVVGQGLYFESPITHFILCEYLAGHGYLVATCPLTGTNTPLVKLDLIDLETQVRDMEYTAGFCHSMIDPEQRKLGIIGFDLGGMSAAIMAMRNSKVNAVVSLDSGIMFEHNLDLLKQTPYYQPVKFRVPLLHITRPAEENKLLGVKEDRSFIEAAKYSDKTIIQFAGMSHAAFTSYSMLERIIPGITNSKNSDPAKSYEILCLYILEFLNARLKDTPEKYEAIKKNIPEPELVTIESIPISDTHCSPYLYGDEFINIIMKGELEKAEQIYKSVKEKCPSYQLFSESGLNTLGYYLLYRQNRINDAIKVFSLNAIEYTESANALDSLGEAYMVAGDLTHAIENYKKSLELNPNNQNAKNILQQIKSRQENK